MARIDDDESWVLDDERDSDDESNSEDDGQRNCSDPGPMSPEYVEECKRAEEEFREHSRRAHAGVNRAFARLTLEPIANGTVIVEQSVDSLAGLLADYGGLKCDDIVYRLNELQSDGLLRIDGRDLVYMGSPEALRSQFHYYASNCL